MAQSIQPPLIGITTYGQKQTGKFYLPGSYVDAVYKAGGVPMLLPPVPVDPALMLERLDGLVLIGGGDIDPTFYNGSPHPAIYNVDQERDTFELALAGLALNNDLPILGLCRGLEVMVVVSGGDLIAHVPDEFGLDVIHRAEPPLQAEHRVQLVPDSKLAEIAGTTEVTVVSLHHQAVRTVPQGWRVAGRATDGVIEAVEHEQHPFAIAVQWHPELSQDNPHHQRLFAALIAAARTRQAAVPQPTGV